MEDSYKRAQLGEAKWVSTGGKCGIPLIRGVFRLPGIKAATITIAALGAYEVYLNGRRVGEDLFLPLSTEYHARENLSYGPHPFLDEFRFRLYCPVYDITSYLKEGDNTVCCMMGPGWYDRDIDGYGHIKISYRMEYEDMSGEKHSVVSDGTLKWTESYIKEANFWRGETHDYTVCDDSWMEPSYDDSAWEQVMVETPPETNLYVLDCPTDRIIRHVEPKLIREEDGTRIYDVGELITGYPIFVSGAPAGEMVRVRYGELLNEEGGLNEGHIYNQHTDFKTDGTSRRLHCKFTWLCFQYFEVKGDAKVEDCVVIHSDIDVTSSFSCSSEVLNWLRDAYIRTELDNMHCGIPSDCPHVERLGYTGDGQLTCAAAMLQLDARKFYRKWIYDIADCQDSKTGHVQYTCPFRPAGGGPGGWGCAIVVVPYEYYREYGDVDILRELYPQMLHWFDYMESHSEGNLVMTDHEGAWCLGDWCVPAMRECNLDDIGIPAPFVNTYFYVKMMQLVLKISDILDIHENDSRLQEKIERKKQAMTARYFDRETGDFAENLQGSNAFALDIGMGDERTFDNMLDHYREIGEYDTGIFGTEIVTRLLFERGQEDLAIVLLTSEKDASFHRQMRRGATTIPEYWTGYRSQCHPMFGAVARYLFDYILGIRQREGTGGFEKVLIEPKCMHLIPSARGHITTEKGVISVEYDDESVQVSVPRGVEALLRVDGREYPLEFPKFRLQRA